MKLRRQMILLIAAPTLLIYVVILGFTTLYSYRESKASVERSMTLLAAGYASRLEGQLREVAQIAETTADFLQTAGSPPDDRLYAQLERNVSRSPLVYGACIAFEPGANKAGDVLFAPYVCRDGKGFRRMDINRSVYDWYADPQYTWYTQPKSLGHGVWSDPYFDDGAGNILMATYSATFNLHGKFGGVTTVDIDLPQLHKTVGRGFDQSLDFVILNAGGHFVYDPDAKRIMSRSIFDLAKEKNNPALSDLGRKVLAGGSGVETIDAWDSSERQWVFYSPIPSAGWVFVGRFPESRVLAEVREHAIWNAGALGVTLLLIVTCVVVVSRLVASPISRLNEKVAQVGAGDLGVQIDESSRTQELRTLAASFNKMTSQLRSHVDNMAAEQAARARIEHDLSLARKIQQSLLPAANPTNEHLEVAGHSRYCDATGGDYYDFMDISDVSPGAAFIVIGDVSGHGIAAALLMASARAGLRVQAGGSGQLSQMLSKVNQLLAADNRHNRFMTITLLVIDPLNHTARWASAGHDPTILYHPDTDSFEELDGGGLPLGVMAEESYEEYSSKQLRAGDLLILGTDGIWEMRNASGEMFGKERLRALMRQHVSKPAHEVAAAIEKHLDEYRGEVRQADDVTFVVVRVK